MRVIAGVNGGRRLSAPAGRATRPTSDRVREAAFSMLASLDAVAGARVWDLFAGSGAMGIEALSRGAAHATFVDSARAALQATRANLAQMGYGTDRAEVVGAEALGWVSGVRDGVDLVIADPPYAWEGWAQLLAALSPYRPLVLMETGVAVALPPAWSVLKSKRYGGTVVTLARRPPGDDL